MPTEDSTWTHQIRGAAPVFFSPRVLKSSDRWGAARVPKLAGQHGPNRPDAVTSIYGSVKLRPSPTNMRICCIYSFYPAMPQQLATRARGRSSDFSLIAIINYRFQKHRFLMLRSERWKKSTHFRQRGKEPGGSPEEGISRGLHACSGAECSLFLDTLRRGNSGSAMTQNK